MANDVKCVKVDNWAVFFLQKLQTFFNTTVNCDLTLHFDDNSQLKVHRLVLSACTNYFSVLESTCQMVDGDTLIMPTHLQADVVVPIVNFMYTGTLEFEMSMYDRLLKTAHEMKMTVLLKLLEAHKLTTVAPRREPVLLNNKTGLRIPVTATIAKLGMGGRQGPVSGNRGSAPGGNAPSLRRIGPPHSRVLTRGGGVRQVANSSRMRMISADYPEPAAHVAKYTNSNSVATKGPSRYEIDEPEEMENSFDALSYESRPLITANQVKKEDEDDRTNSNFDMLRSTATVTNKRPLSNRGVSSSPPEKKPNIEDVKEYTEAQRLRKQIAAAEFDDEANDYGEDEPHFNDDDDEDMAPNSPQPPNEVKRNVNTPLKTFGRPTRVNPVARPNNNENKPSTSKGAVTPTITNDDGQPPRPHHAKIISEVLKKYPHLVRSSANIRVKISQSSKPPVDPTKVSESETPHLRTYATGTTTVVTSGLSSKTPAASYQVKTSPVSASKARPPKYTRFNLVNLGQEEKTSPLKIDVKRMHDLINLGPENTTGPWLCLRCGVNGKPVSMPSYRTFRRHLVEIHKERIDARLCTECGYRSTNKDDLEKHLLLEHNIMEASEYMLLKCRDCAHVAITREALFKHIQERHSVASKSQQCIYCNKSFNKEQNLYAHMRQAHKDRARDDGVMNFSDDDSEHVKKYGPNHPIPVKIDVKQRRLPQAKNKIKVLSDIKLPAVQTPYSSIDLPKVITVPPADQCADIELEPSSEAEGLSNVASGITTSISVLNADTIEANQPPMQYIEEAMASVHGEDHDDDVDDDDETTNKNGMKVVTKFVTAEGDQLDLSEEQQVELLQQLTDQGDEMIVVQFSDQQKPAPTDGENKSNTNAANGDDDDDDEDEDDDDDDQEQEEEQEADSDKENADEAAGDDEGDDDENDEGEENRNPGGNGDGDDDDNDDDDEDDEEEDEDEEHEVEIEIQGEYDEEEEEKETEASKTAKDDKEKKTEKEETDKKETKIDDGDKSEEMEVDSALKEDESKKDTDNKEEQKESTECATDETQKDDTKKSDEDEKDEESKTPESTKSGNTKKKTNESKKTSTEKDEATIPIEKNSSSADDMLKDLFSGDDEPPKKKSKADESDKESKANEDTPASAEKDSSNAKADDAEGEKKNKETKDDKPDEMSQADHDLTTSLLCDWNDSLSSDVLTEPIKTQDTSTKTDDASSKAKKNTDEDYKKASDVGGEAPPPLTSFLGATEQLPTPTVSLPKKEKRMGLSEELLKNPTISTLIDDWDDDDDDE